MSLVGFLGKIVLLDGRIINQTPMTHGIATSLRQGSVNPSYGNPLWPGLEFLYASLQLLYRFLHVVVNYLHVKEMFKMLFQQLTLPR